MSAFIVQDNTINNIVGHLIAHQHSGRYDHAFRILAPLRIYTMKEHGQRKMLALEMHKLNVYAVNGRYNEVNSWEDFEYAPKFDIGRCQALKSIQCWLYQCSEIDAMEKPIFKFIEEVEHSLMRSLIGEMPEYNKAKWD